MDLLGVNAFFVIMQDTQTLTQSKQLSKVIFSVSANRVPQQFILMIM